MIKIDSRNTLVIGVDDGYGNIKTANTITPTGITAYDTRPIFSGNILEYDGKYYRIGEGHKEFIADKSDDEDFYLLTLMAIARELHTKAITKANVHLAVGLPLTWVRSQRESFSKYLLRNPDVDFVFNGQKYELHFTGCIVFPQGYPAIVNRLDEAKGVNMLADIGNGTMNILYVINKKAVESKAWTEKFGVNQCVIAARNAVMDAYQVKIDETIVEQVLRSGTADIGKKYLDVIIATAKRYTAGIFEVLRKYEYNPDLMRLIICGGGGCLIRNFGTYDPRRVSFITDLCAAAKGYELLAMTMLTKEGLR